MNKQIKAIFVLAFTLVMSVTSCLNEVSDPNGGGNALPGNVESLDSQVAAMKTSIGDLESVSGALVGVTETLDVDALKAELESCSASVQDHIASVESGAQAVASTLKALELQAEIAQTVGALKAQVEMLEANGMTRVLTERIQTLEEGVASWLGDKFENYYLVSSEQVRANELGSIAEDQSLSVDALQSDVEAGLRVGDATEELAAMAKTVGNNSQALAKLSNEFSTLSSEVKEVYSDAIKSADSDTKSTLKSVNTKAAAALKSSTPTLADLASRISACETAIEDINNRLTQLEASVDKLLSKIQSLTFMSDYSSDYAVAYYEMKNAKVSAPGKAYDGKNQRDAAGTIDLSFMIRPASAAAAVSAQTASVFGYYADKMQTSAVDPSNFVNFQVQSVSVTNAERGIVTVRISHDLKDDFYYKQTGAKCALSIATGKTDIISKFVELVPKDNSSTVYVEGIKLNQDDFEIDEGQTKTLTATVNPSSATNKTVTWTSSNTEIATIDQYSGVLTAVKQGNVTITATTNGIDEWGDNLTASVNVKVNPSIRIGGPIWVEVGKTAELSLDKPATMNIESQEWYTSDPDKMTVERVNGIVTVTGLVPTYNEYTYQYNTVTVYCTINGTTTVSYEMKVVVPQPNQIKFNNYGDDVKQIRMKLDQSLDLGGVILPVEASNLYRLYYESTSATGPGWVDKDNGKINPYGSTLPAEVVTVTAKAFEIDKHHRYATDYIYTRSIKIFVDPYYVSTISFADVELEPGANVTLVPTFTSDVSGKQPTNTKLIWESSNSQIATVDENGLVNALGEGDVTITATATDGSGVKGTCKVTITAPWKEFEIGDYVVRKSNGEIEFFTSSTDAKNNGTVVGVVIYKGNPRVSDTKLPADCTHGIAIGLGESNGKWWSSSQNVEPYHLTGYVNSSYNTAGYVLPGGVQGSFTNPTLSDLGKKPYGYNNTMLFKEFLAFKNNGTTSDILTKLNEYNADNNKRTPTGASSWYLPSICEMYAVYTANNLLNGSLNTILKGVGGTTLTNNSSWPYWTVSEHADSPSTYAAAINPITGAVYGKFKTTTSTYVRFVFAF